MKVITFDDIKALNISPITCYNWAVEMIADKKNTILPAKISIKPADGVFCNVMPSMIPQSVFGTAGGVKVVTRYPDRNPSLDSKILLFNASNGEFLALMDGDWITTMRTGAVSAHSIMLFAKEGFSQIGMMGLGNTARSVLIVLAAMMPEKEFHVKLLRYKGQEQLFQKRFAKYSNLNFSIVDDAASLVKGSDVVISAATYLPKDLCTDDCFDEGVLVVPIHTLGFTNCDLFFDKIFADDYNHVCHFKNFNKFKKFSEVCDVVNRKAPGRENSKERILAYNIGISIHDINFAAHIYQILSEKGKLEDIDLKNPTDKFWL